MKKLKSFSQSFRSLLSGVGWTMLAILAIFIANYLIFGIDCVFGLVFLRGQKFIRFIREAFLMHTLFAAAYSTALVDVIFSFKIQKRYPGFVSFGMVIALFIAVITPLAMLAAITIRVPVHFPILKSLIPRIILVGSLILYLIGLGLTQLWAYVQVSEMYEDHYLSQAFPRPG